MGLFSTRNSDGASGKAESANTISSKDWKSIQDRAAKANPQLADSFSDEAVARRHRSAASLRNREQN